MKLLPHLCCLFWIQSSNPFCSAAQPAWPVLNALFHQPVDGPLVRDLIRKYDLSRTVKFDSGSYSPSDRSYSLMFDGDRIDCIILHFGPWPAGGGYETWTSYSEPAPFGLLASDDRSDVIRKLGAPDEFPKSDTWIFKGYRLMLIFDPKSGKIEEAYISRDDVKTPN